MASKGNNQLATKSDVQEIVDQATDAVLDGVGRLLEDYATKDGLKKVETRLDRLETEVSGLRNDVRDVKTELSDTPSVKEFERLKAKVSRHHPAN